MTDAVSGDNGRYQSCKSPVKLSPPTNQHRGFYRPDALPFAQPTVSEYCFYLLRYEPSCVELMRQLGTEVILKVVQRKQCNYMD